MEACQKILAPPAPPFKVTQTHWNRYLWLPISDTQ